VPIFELIRARGGVPEAELYQVFNMGIGMTLIVPAERAPAVVKFSRAHGHPAWVIGQTVRGRGQARVE
jgi:phosphoribosylformylglycinamidine cyclo-ligase